MDLPETPRGAGDAPMQLLGSFRARHLVRSRREKCCAYPVQAPVQWAQFLPARTRRSPRRRLPTSLPHRGRRGAARAEPRQPWPFSAPRGLPPGVLECLGCLPGRVGILALRGPALGRGARSQDDTVTLVRKRLHTFPARRGRCQTVALVGALAPFNKPPREAPRGAGLVPRHLLGSF